MKKSLNIFKKMLASVLLACFPFVSISTAFAVEDAATSTPDMIIEQTGPDSDPITDNLDAVTATSTDAVPEAPITDPEQDTVEAPVPETEEIPPVTDENPTEIEIVEPAPDPAVEIEVPAELPVEEPAVLEEPVAEEPLAIFVRTRIEPVEASLPSVLARDVSASVEPADVQALAQIPPPPVPSFYEEEIAATTTDFLIDKATSTEVAATSTESAATTTDPAVPIPDAEEMPDTDQTPPVPEPSGATTTPEMLPLPKPEDEPPAATTTAPATGEDVPPILTEDAGDLQPEPDDSSILPEDTATVPKPEDTPEEAAADADAPVE